MSNIIGYEVLYSFKKENEDGELEEHYGSVVCKLERELFLENNGNVRLIAGRDEAYDDWNSTLRNLSFIHQNQFPIDYEDLEFISCEEITSKKVWTNRKDKSSYHT